RNDPSALVRLYLASALQRIPPEQRWDIVEGLSRRAEDKDDHNLPLMVWYATEPLIALDMDRAMALAEHAELPNLLLYTIKCAASTGTDAAKAKLRKLGEKFGTASDHQRYHEAQMMIDEILK